MIERLVIVPSSLVCNFTPPHFSYHNINTYWFFPSIVSTPRSQRRQMNKSDLVWVLTVKK